VSFVSERASGAVGVVEDDGDGGLGDAGLALLVYEFLEVGSPDLLQVGDAEDEADGIEDVGLAGTVQAGDGVEERVKARNHGAGRVGLEPFQANLLDIHRRRGRGGNHAVFRVLAKQRREILTRFKMTLDFATLFKFCIFFFLLDQKYSIRDT